MRSAKLAKCVSLVLLAGVTGCGLEGGSTDQSAPQQVHYNILKDVDYDYAEVLLGNERLFTITELNTDNPVTLFQRGRKTVIVAVATLLIVEGRQVNVYVKATVEGVRLRDISNCSFYTSPGFMRYSSDDYDAAELKRYIAQEIRRNGKVSGEICEPSREITPGSRVY